MSPINKTTWIAGIVVSTVLAVSCITLLVLGTLGIYKMLPLTPMTSKAFYVTGFVGMPLSTAVFFSFLCCCKPKSMNR